MPPRDAATEVAILRDATDASDLGTPDVPPDVARDTGDGGVADVRADASMDVPPRPSPRLVAEAVNNRVVTRELMFASIEMQQSGEPLAESFGRDLAGYDRFTLPTDQYREPLADGGLAPPVRDLVGFASAIESYEYSKMHMNMLAFESSGGVALAYGPLINPMNVDGEAARTLVRDRVQRWSLQSHAGVRSLTLPDGGVGPPRGFVTVPPPSDNPLNTLGFGGFWPTLHPFLSFTPTVRPSTASTQGCSLTSGYGASAGDSIIVGDYECGYSTLHLLTRNDALETELAISPGASGWAGWKYGFWVVNYLQIMHDVDNNPIESVPEAELGNVGREDNSIVGRIAGAEPCTRPDGGVLPDGAADTNCGTAGTFIGSSDVEGFQAAFMIEEIDNQAHHWLTALNTADGTTLSGFRDLREALAYDYTRPLRWIPSVIGVTEARAARDSNEFPRPTRYQIRNASSRLFDLLGLVGSYSEFFALTDRSNGDVGGAQTDRVYFDGDPFPADNQRADGENTLHDRALAMMKFVFVTLDRVHRDPMSNLLADEVTFAGSTPTRGATVSTTSVAYTIVALRSVRRALGSNLTLYSNDTPDTAVTRTRLDETSFAGSPGGATLTGRITALLRSHADLLLQQLTTAGGNARPGWNIATRMPTSTTGDLDAHAAAVRGLLEAFLATGDTRYRDRAETVFQRLEFEFYNASARAYRSAPGLDAPIVFNPLRFGLLQSALREMYKLVAARPGREAFAAVLEERIARLDKLVLNGWDDRDGDDTVDWPGECVHVRDGLPRGGLQIAERALTGETGIEPPRPMGGRPTEDRDHDCVPEIDDALVPASLAAEIRFRIAAP